MEDNDFLYAIATAILPEYSPYGKVKDENFDVDKFLDRCEEVTKSMKPLIQSLSKDEDEEEDFKNAGEEIVELREEISNLKSKKEETILRIIGLMYKGVLISERVTIRKDKCFRYRSHNYDLDVNSLKNDIMENIHEVNEKLTTSNVDILEFILDKVEERERTIKEKREKELKFDELSLVDSSTHSYFSRKNKHEIDISLIKANCVYINDKGEIKFCLKKDKEEDKEEELSITSRLHNILCFKFKTSLDEMAKDFIKELKEDIEKRNEELKEIQKKGSPLLMLAEIQKGNNIKGWGE